MRQAGSERFPGERGKLDGNGRDDRKLGVFGEPLEVGCPGGTCLAPTDQIPEPRCHEGLCDLEGAYCYDPNDPCRGFDCGGADRGTCSVMDDLPFCTCHPGHDKTYNLYCCPQDGSDPRCP